MYCGICGQENPNENQFCIACGKELRLPHAATASGHAAVAVAPAKAASSGGDTQDGGKKLQGVRGWLLYFALVLTVFIPAAAVLEMTSEPRGPTPLELLLDGGLGIFSLVTGVAVWRVTEAALKLVKAYVLTVGILAVGIFIFGLSAGAGSDALATIARPALGAAIIAMYFHDSKRVKATFGRNL